MRKLVILGLLMGISAFTFAQSFKYEFIDESQGLFERFVYSLEQDQNGYILIGTTEGLFRFADLSLNNLMSKADWQNLSSHVQRNFLINGYYLVTIKAGSLCTTERG